MEKVMNQANEVEVFENDIQIYLEEFCEKNNIDDMKKEPQNVWNAALMYIRRNVFNTPGMLKDKTPLDGYHNDNYYLNNSNCNRYDMKIIHDVCDYYIYLCMLYAKEISTIGFCNLTGITIQTIYNWGHEGGDSSTARFELCKKLKDFNEESLSNILISGTRQPVGVIAALNRRHGWNSPYVAGDNERKKSLSTMELPRLGCENSEITQIVETKDTI